ncbi:hypothetical protein SAMN05216232_3091 [Virgibacillus subterraneus]|uniref:Metallo-beta-lactamase domain-containing protein n=1 Tax=Virgibacillus subterraneus TaxID=621109 RepID=A0A1H9I8U4_9BACI|nr:MBL fold metallo-hydrolase [Virgibacillus subterraneus]SEQ70982.1 hypothetical protein SAMN05216232_3091 [Virgibacillus subterraneus]
MGFEVDFLPVGENSKNGDAIAVRYGHPGNYKVMIVDGGTKQSGEKLVSHIQDYYNTNYVDFVVNTHPDADHASGLSVVLEELEVGELWMHLPWLHSQTIREMFKDGRITDNSLSERIKNSLNAAYNVYEIAEEKGINIYEPFEGDMIGNFTVMSPNKDWYINELLPNFEGMPEKKEAEYASIFKSFQEMVQTTMRKVAEYIDETWEIETLKEGVKTSARNESSVVLFSNLDGNGILLTGDAGIQALDRVSDFAENSGINLLDCKFIQVPHHGSRHNVSPSALDRILGEKISADTEATKRAYASVSKGAEDYPRRSVANAFRRRGAKVFSTKGKTIWYYNDMSDRDGWSPIEPLPFYDKVEE